VFCSLFISLIFKLSVTKYHRKSKLSTQDKPAQCRHHLRLTPATTTVKAIHVVMLIANPASHDQGKKVNRT
jgi:hypothetical protein